MWETFVQALGGLTWGRFFASGAAWVALLVPVLGGIGVIWLRWRLRKLGPSDEWRAALMGARECCEALTEQGREDIWFKKEPYRQGRELYDLADRTTDKRLKQDALKIAETLGRISNDAPKNGPFFAIQGKPLSLEKQRQTARRAAVLFDQKNATREILPIIKRAIERLNKMERKSIR